MDEATILDRIKSTEWHYFAQPEWNAPGSVADALTKLATATNASSSSAAYDLVLSALGDDDEGTYYPVALATLPILEMILRHGSPWAQRAVLGVLDDLYGSLDANAELREGIRKMRPLLENIIAASGPNADLAEELSHLVN